MNKKKTIYKQTSQYFNEHTYKLILKVPVLSLISAQLFINEQSV